MPLEPIHEAALAGDEAEVVRLVPEDAGRLNAQVQGYTMVDGWNVNGCTPLILAAFKGHDTVTRRLLALGADVGLVEAVGWTALHWAVWGGHDTIVSLLLQAGADPTTRDRLGKTPLHYASNRNERPCIALLRAAIAPSQCARLLLKARTLIGATSYPDAPIPAYLRSRLTATQHGQPLPSVEITTTDSQDEALTACVRFVLGLEGHGGFAAGEGMEGGMRTDGLPHELFMELCELLVPRWDRKNL